MKEVSLNFNWQLLPKVTDTRGTLTYIEENDTLSFPIRYISFLESKNSSEVLNPYFKFSKVALVGIKGTASMNHQIVSFSTVQSKIYETTGEELKEISFSEDFVGLVISSHIGENNNKLINTLPKEYFLFPPDQDPVQIPRIFLISDVNPHSIRGSHAHKTCHQILYMLKGSCEVTLEKNGIKSKMILGRDKTFIHLPKETWLELKKFSPKSVLLVLSSEKFIEENYIRDYNLYKKYCGINTDISYREK